MSSSRPWLAAAFAAVLAASVLPVLTSASAGAATGDKPLFTAVANARMAGEKRRVDATHYSAVNADLARIRTTLTKAPADARSGAGLAFDVPTPAGTFERFSLFRTSVMESGLAAAHPELATWSGRSLDNPGTTVALDLTPMGFHASVRGPLGQRAWYVDPAYNERGTSLSLSYYGGSIPPERRVVRREGGPRAGSRRRGPAGRRDRTGRAVKQRIYRLALVTDPSYADYFGAENVLAEKVTLVNRVDQIYNDDLSIRMVLVNNTDDLNLDTVAKASGPNGPVRLARLLRPRPAPTRPRPGPARVLRPSAGCSAPAPCSASWSAPATTTSATSGWASTVAASPSSASSAPRSRRRAAPAPRRTATSTRSTTWRTRWATSSTATTPSTGPRSTARAATATATPRSSRAPVPR